MKKILNQIKFSYLLFFLPLFLHSPGSALAATTHTVCPLGCDFTQISSTTPGAGALEDPSLVSGDTIELTSTYHFDEAQENFSTSIPVLATGVTLSCDAGADTIGDNTVGIYNLSLSDSSEVTGCSFEKADIANLAGANNLKIQNNTFNNLYNSNFFITDSNNFTISGNSGVSQLNIQNSDDGLIQNNIVDIIPGEDTGMDITAESGTTDAGFGLSANVPDNVQILGNTFNNYDPANTGDWIYIGAGKNIEFANNTVQGKVTSNDVYITMITFQDAQVNADGNLVISPLKPLGATNGTWAFNNRTGQYGTQATYTHNTIYLESQDDGMAGGDACIGLFDSATVQTLSPIPININATYNLCYHHLTTPNGAAINLDYNSGSPTLTTALTFIENHNGFYGFSTSPINDTTLTSQPAADATDIFSNPLFRRENVSTTDDFQLNPISRYLDVNAGEDIGAFGDNAASPNNTPRSTTTLIDKTCTIDYLTCHAQDTTILQDSLESGDAIQLAAGTYSGFVVNDLTNLNISGAGASTIIDGTGFDHAIELVNVSNSNIHDLAVENAQTPLSVYDLTSTNFSTLTEDYNVPPFPLFFANNNCSGATFINGTTDVTAIAGVGTADISLALVHIPDPPNPDAFYTIFIENPTPATQAQVESDCSIPPGIIQKFVPSIFQLQGDGSYLYNSAAAASAGVFPTAAGANPQLVHHNTDDSSGIILDDSSNNQITNVTSTNNGNGIYFSAGAGNNTVSSCDLTGNTVSDVHSDTVGDNTLQQVKFNLADTSVINTGVVNVFGKFQASVVGAISGNPPIPGASMLATNPLGSQGTFTTDVSGLTPISPLVQILRLSAAQPNIDTAGGYNPFYFLVTASGYTQVIATANLVQDYTGIIVPLAQSLGVSSGGGGGGSSSFGQSACSGPNCLTTTNNVLSSGNISTPATHDYFTDIANHWANSFINALAKKGIAKGYSDNTFRPDHDVTRAEFTTLIVRAFYPDYLTQLQKTSGLSFPDLDPNGWYTDVLAFAKQKQIINGYGDGLFRPDQTINRAEALKIILLAASFDLSGNLTATPFPDVDNQAWYIKFVDFAYQNKFISGYIGGKDDGKFGPANSITRAESAKIIEVVLEFLAKK